MRVDSTRNVPFFVHDEFSPWSIFADGHIEGPFRPLLELLDLGWIFNVESGDVAGE